MTTFEDVSIGTMKYLNGPKKMHEGTPFSFLNEGISSFTFKDVTSPDY